MPPAKRERAGLRVKLLGGFEIRLASGAPVVLPTRKAQAVLAYLSVRPGHAHARDKLAALLWGDRGESQARDSLRHTLVDLRKVLPARGPSVIGEGHSVALDPAAVDVDVVRFETLAAAPTAEGLTEAAEIYQGDFLEGFVLREPAFEEWLVAERERLRELALGALRRLLEHQGGHGASEPAIRTALRLLALDATEELAHRALMRLYVRQGRRAAALRQYQTCVSVLQRELGTEPEAETRQLYQEIVQRHDGPRSARPAATRLIAAKASPAPASASRPAGIGAESSAAETPLVGRSTELATLGNALDEIRWGRGRVVAIMGEAGVGKSRLITELVRTATERDARVLLGRCYESEQILPFGPWVDALRAGQVVPSDPALGALEPPWRAELARLFPEISVTGLPAPTDDPRRLFEAVTRVIGALSTNHPVLLVLEDVHWADDMTSRLLVFLGRRVAQQRVLVAATAREEELPDAAALRRALGELRAEGHFTELALAPLSRAETSVLVQALAGAGSDAEAVARLADQAWATSEGNPFVVVETIRAVREGTTLEAPARLSVPHRVRDVIVRRLERLSDRSRDLLSVAAVIGREFEFALLQRASGVTDRDAAGGVEELVRRRMLHGVDDGFDFTHDRIREAVYAGLLPPRRKLLHGDVAAALEALTVGSFDRPAAALGMHYRQAEVWDKAVFYLREAGAKAKARSAFQDARLCLEQALAALQTLLETAATLAEAFDVRIELRPALYQLGEVEAGLQNLREAEALAERLNDDRRRSRVGALLTNMNVQLGRLEDAHASGTRALAIARALGDLDLRVVATTYLGQLLHYRGEYAQQAALIAENVAALPADWLYEDFGIGIPVSIFDRAQLVMSLAPLGRFAEAAEHEAEVIRLAEPTNHPYTVGLAHMAGAIHRLLQGDWRSARSLAEQSIAMLRTGNVIVLLSTSLACSAWALARLGEVSDVPDRVRNSEQLLARMYRTATGPRGTTHGWAFHCLGRACLLLGRVDDAQRLCDRAIEFSAPGYAPYALHLLGDIIIHPDRFDAEAAEATYRDALAMAEPRGMRPLVAHCHLGLGKLYTRTSKREQAQEHLRTATAMYRELQMPFWLGQAEAAREA